MSFQIKKGGLSKKKLKDSEESLLELLGIILKDSTDYLTGFKKRGLRTLKNINVNK